jgi:O-antigen/teichoic acid export membrane protein
MGLNLSVIKSIAGSTFFKIASSLVSFFAVPLLLKALGTHDYGIWVTLAAMVAWLNIFDFGSGYSLKNKVTESLVSKDKSFLKILIAGTIQFYVLATFVILLVFVGCLFFIKAFRENIVLSLILYLPVIIAFPFTLGHFMMQGLKKFNLFNFLLLLQSLIWLITIVLYSSGIIHLDIYKIAIVYGLLYITANFCVFYISLRFLEFNWKELFDFSHFKSSKDSLLVGGRFFLLQISSLMLFSLGNLMTYDNLQVKDVAQFDTVNKIFLIGMTFFNVIIAIFWAEISHAKALKAKVLLFKVRNQLLLVSLFFSIGTCIVAYFMPFIIPFWTKGIINIEFIQLLPFIFLVVIQYFAYAGAVVLNAFEDLKGQVVLSVFASIFIIPLAKYFFSIGIGIGSVPLASAILILPTLIYVLYKSNNCINNIIE